MIREIGIKKFSVEQIAEILDGVRNIRPISRKNVEQYKRAMRLGKWRPGASSIAFTEDGTLGDGFHRLTAALELQLPFETSVKVDATPEDIAVMDQGQKRSASVMAKVLKKLSNQLDLAVALEYGLDTKVNASNDERLELRVKHEEAIEFVAKNFKKIPLAARLEIAYEYQRIREDGAKVIRLAELGDVLKTNIPKSPADHPALKLVKYFAETQFADHGKRAECAEKTLTTIRKFMGDKRK